MPETFDLDALFADLEHDVAGLTSGRGAGQAVAAARRRRRTTIGAVAAVAVLAIGGAAIASGLPGRNQSVGPAGSLPEPAPLTAANLSAATDGWLSAWTAQSPDEAHFPSGGPVWRCLRQTPSANAVSDQTRGSGNLFFGSGDTTGLGWLAGFDAAGEGDGLFADVASTFDGCAGSTPTGQLTWDGAQARSYDVVSASGAQEHFWIASEGDTFGYFWAVDEPGKPSANTDDAVSRALVAALLYPGSMHAGDGSESSSSSSSSSASPVVTISDSDFAAAVQGWDSGWSANGGQGDASSLPCGAQVSDARFGMGTSLGSNGDQETYGFANPQAARSAVDDLTSTLTACTSATYAVTSAPTSYGTDVTVVTGTGPGAQAIWLVQLENRVAWIAVPDPSSTPPAAVSKAVGDLLVFDLKASPTGSDTSGSGPTEEKTATAPSSSSATNN